MLVIKETWEDGRTSCISGESEWYEPFTDDLGILFKSLQREHGRCVSKVYQDNIDGTSFACGWVFEKIQEYKNSPEKFLVRTWITHKHILRKIKKGRR